MKGGGEENGNDRQALTRTMSVEGDSKRWEGWSTRQALIGVLTVLHCSFSKTVQYI